jgi:hypothetical protein
MITLSPVNSTVNHVRTSGVWPVRLHLRPRPTRHGACLLYDSIPSGRFECEVIRADYAAAMEVEGEA